MDIDAIASSGPDRATVQRLSQRSDARGALQLAVHAGLLGATGLIVAASRGHPWLVPALIVHGVVLTFLFCALHETVHRTAFASRRLNDGVAWVCGALLVLPPEYFRCFHFAHHRFTQQPGRDPELALPAPATAAAYLWRISGLPYWGERLATTLRHALSGRTTEPFIAAGKSAAVVREARVLWLCYLGVAAASVWLRSDAALIYWVLPALLGQPFLRLFLLAEHTGCPFVEDMFANTRTTFSNRAVLILAWRMPYHAEHHCCPSVPFHALPRLHALVRGRLQVTAPGYLRLHLGFLRRLTGQRLTLSP